MIAICLESSHARGTGHLFRGLNLIEFLSAKEIAYRLIVNEDPNTHLLLKKKGIPFETADFKDLTSNWETRIIQKHRITLWWNDRMETLPAHSKFVKQNGIPLVTLDDAGKGAELADLHIAPLILSESRAPAGKQVLTGVEYMVLNPAIDRCKRLREKRQSILVTMGGSDTYGMTQVVFRCLKELDIPATLHIGPSFRGENELYEEAGEDYPILSSTPSLVATMADFDLAITGGGITPFEANASGLPCLIISGENHERQNCKYLERIGSSIYLGHRDQIDSHRLKTCLEKLDIRSMSQAGMTHITTRGLENIWKHIEPLIYG